MSSDENAAERDAVPKMTLEEALKRFRIEGDIEEDMARSGWQDDAVKDIFGASDD